MRVPTENNVRGFDCTKDPTTQSLKKELRMQNNTHVHHPKTLVHFHVMYVLDICFRSIH